MKMQSEPIMPEMQGTSLGLQIGLMHCYLNPRLSFGIKIHYRVLGLVYKQQRAKIRR